MRGMKPGLKYVVFPIGLSDARTYSAALYTCGRRAARASPTRSLAAAASDFISSPLGWWRRVSSIARSSVSFSPGCKVSRASADGPVAIVSRQPANTSAILNRDIRIVLLRYSFGFREHVRSVFGLSILLHDIDYCVRNYRRIQISYYRLNPAEAVDNLGAFAGADSDGHVLFAQLPVLRDHHVFAIGRIPNRRLGQPERVSMP